MLLPVVLGLDGVLLCPAMADEGWQLSLVVSVWGAKTCIYLYPAKADEGHVGSWGTRGLKRQFPESSNG
jgi:hypothetical protein